MMCVCENLIRQDRIQGLIKLDILILATFWNSDSKRPKIEAGENYRYQPVRGPIHRWVVSGAYNPTYHQSAQFALCSIATA